MPSVEQGQRTRREILRTAADLASTGGLGGLTIGGLAASVGMSKGGVYGHFGSKDDLQVAVVDAAAERFREAVIEPADATAPGLERAWALVHGWLDSIEDAVFPGGCFFYHTGAELDDRPGPARERLVEVMEAWLGTLTEQLDIARRTGELPRSDPEMLAFRIHAYVLRAAWEARLLEDDTAFDRARAAVDAVLTPGPAASGADAAGSAGRDASG